MKCRHCEASLHFSFVDLRSAPLSNAYLTESSLKRPELWFPLRVSVCTRCWLVQTEDYAAAEQIFTNDYPYFSSYSESWLEHSKAYVDMVVDRFKLNQHSRVVELGANDGCLLRFVAARQIPCIGVEPAASAANSARMKGLEIIEEFFGVGLAKDMSERGLDADLIIGHNVLAHVPDINDFLVGVSVLLRKNGVATFEFPHLVNVVAQNQFDTIYHEHYSYLSLTALEGIFERNGLDVFDVDQIPTHGGSLRIYVQRNGGRQSRRSAVTQLLRYEASIGVANEAYYADFQVGANRAKNDFLAFLLSAKREGKRVAGYGAAAKGNTLLNYAGVGSDLMPYVVDKDPAKQGKFLPGSRIPIASEERLRANCPDYVVILPWNICTEVIKELTFVREWGGAFVTAIPEIRMH